MYRGTSASAPVSRVARGGIMAFFLYGAGYLLNYCSQLVIARIVGADTYGVYAYVFAWIVVLAYFSTLGFDVGLLRFLPTYKAQRAWALLKGAVSSPELQSTFLAGFALVPVLALVRIRCSAVRAFGGVISGLVPDNVMRDGTLIGLVVFAGVGLGWTFNAPSVMLATLISSALGLV